MPGARLRSTLAATLVVAVALVVGAVGMVWVLRTSLTRTVADSASQRATDVANALTAGTNQASAITGAPGESSVVQVLDSQGRVRLASPDIEGEPPITSVRPASGSVQVVDQSIPVADQGSFVVAARGAQTPSGPVTVVVAQSLESVDASVSAVERLLVAGFPMLLLVVAGSVFLVVGRTLRPVEQIRRRVSAIGATDLGMRVPVPRVDDEVGRLARTMNAMLDRLQRSQAAQRRFIADASHELRSPLAAIRTTVEVSLAHPRHEPWQRSAEDVLTETGRLSTLVDDLLLLARSDEHSTAVDPDDVDLDHIVLLEAERLRRQGRLDIHVDVQPARVAGDRQQLERLVRNLCDNAARHATATVHLQVSSRADGTVIVVQDDGPGIPVADRSRIFDRFVRLDAARDRLSGGAGLGLSIVAEVARCHGGSAAVEDSPRGARLLVRLPGPASASGSAHPPSSASR